MTTQFVQIKTIQSDLLKRPEVVAFANLGVTETGKVGVVALGALDVQAQIKANSANIIDYWDNATYAKLTHDFDVIKPISYAELGREPKVDDVIQGAKGDLYVIKVLNIKEWDNPDTDRDRVLCVLSKLRHNDELVQIEQTRLHERIIPTRGQVVRFNFVVNLNDLCHNHAIAKVEREERKYPTVIIDPDVEARA